SYIGELWIKLLNFLRQKFRIRSPAHLIASRCSLAREWVITLFALEHKFQESCCFLNISGYRHSHTTIITNLVKNSLDGIIRIGFMNLDIVFVIITNIHRRIVNVRSNLCFLVWLQKQKKE